MNNVFKFKVALTVVLFLLALYFLYPTVRLALMGDEERRQAPEKVMELKRDAINLGLDLQGGMHIIMEIDKEKIPEDMEKNPIDEALQIIRNRVDQFGVAEPVIQKQGDNRIIVELPGVENPQRAKELIQQTALLEFKLLAKPYEVTKFIDNMDTLLAGKPELMETGEAVTLEDATTEPTDAFVESLAQEVDELDELATDEEESKAASDESVDDSSVVSATEALLTESTDTVADKSIPGSLISEDEVLKDLLGEDSSLVAEEDVKEATPFSYLINHYKNDNVLIVPASNIAEVERILARVDIDKLLPDDLTIAWGSEEQTNQQTGRKFKFLYVLNAEPELTGRYLSTANFEYGNSGLMAGSPVVNLEFDEKGARLFSQVTGANLQKRLGVVLDGVVYTAPTIKTKITGGRAQITGIQNIEDAKKIAIVLRAGALPAPLKIIEERTVGPSLGQDSINKGLMALLIGAIIVIFFVLIYYRGAGVVANFALFLNIIFLMAIMAILGATLTLPGIAGIILTIGMAIDANVLIFEMIREELASKKTLRSAIDSGYSRAFTTILDANITTIITAIILYNFGTGPIKGFATTLGVGLICSMFTAIIVTRLVFDYYVTKFRPEKLSI